MKTYLVTLLLGWAFFINGTSAQTQPKDSLDFIEHNGIIHLVKDKKTLSLRQVKPIIKTNLEAFEHFKKARRIRNISFVFETISSVSLVIGLVSTDDNALLIGAAGSILFTSLDLALLQEPYNKALLDCIEEFNYPLRKK